MLQLSPKTTYQIALQVIYGLMTNRSNRKLLWPSKPTKISYSALNWKTYWRMRKHHVHDDEEELSFFLPLVCFSGAMTLLFQQQAWSSL